MPNSPTLRRARISFHTTDEDKDGDSNLTVAIHNVDDVMVARTEIENQGFPNNSDNGPFRLSLIETVSKDDLIGGAGTVRFRFEPNGNDTWRFNSTLDLRFSDGSTLVVQKDRLELNQNTKTKEFDIE